MDGHEGDLINKKFVTESEIEERRKTRQEEWEKVRKPEDPEECPEEVYDPRSLYEKLQEQKEKKQQEYEEQFKFKNMVRGLEEDESNFLDEVSRKQELLEKQRRDEERKDNSVSPGAKKLKLEEEHEKLKESQSSSVGRSATIGSQVLCPPASVCIGILPGLGAYSGSSDSESSSDSEATISNMGKIVSSVFRSGTFLDAP
ncbi:PSME3-interacting protein isoform X2 [Rhinoderma darwinii]|uniref:PSME3-interacting protein isoform X2 n=1 Tax=Rhinoderma darwinii TaxID=43563 RepID=UPI003F67F8B2